MSESIQFSGLDEFRAKLMDVSKEYSDTAEKHLNTVGNKLKRKAKDATPVSDRAAVGKRKKLKHMKDMWKSRIVDKGDNDLEYHLRNVSHRFHFVENGHAVKVHGHVVGYYQGQHFFAKTVKEFQSSDEMNNEMEKFMKEVKKKMG